MFDGTISSNFMVKHLNIKIYGRVQGIFFRYSAKLQADSLKITGFARNEDDGSLFIEAEGEEENLKTFLSWCKKGPPLAKVERIEVTEGDLKNFPKFSTH